MDISADYSFEAVLKSPENQELIRQTLFRSTPVPLWRRMRIAVGCKGRKTLAFLVRMLGQGS